LSNTSLDSYFPCFTVVYILFPPFLAVLGAEIPGRKFLSGTRQW
jgi:hypothetical protein